VYEPGWYWPHPDNPVGPPTPTEAGTTDIFYFFYAKYKPGEIIDWPYGHSGFILNYITLYNIEYY
jgi:hypothetical protein